MNNSTLKWFKSLKHTHEYIAEKLKIDLAFSIEKIMADKNIKRNQLAEKIGSSPAYITKVLSGDANLTIESISKLSFALDMDPHIKLCNKHAKFKWAELPKISQSTPKQNVINMPQIKWNTTGHSPKKQSSDSMYINTDNGYDYAHLA